MVSTKCTSTSRISFSLSGKIKSKFALLLFFSLWLKKQQKRKLGFYFDIFVQSPVMSSFFDKFSPTIIVGGTYSGQIVLWDTRARATPVQHTPLSSVGHTHPVYCMEIVGTKNAHNLVSVSTDGRLCVWSLDNLLQPIVRCCFILKVSRKYWSYIIDRADLL